ncbi:hypothetical protein [Bradyrhizobium sp. STM 3557]|uniref:hypothetical protein n=1 Tax=Bradyrhizobium sp. STM 3557 TaxID=578920 RepID=UPI00388DB44B
MSAFSLTKCLVLWFSSSRPAWLRGRATLLAEVANVDLVGAGFDDFTAEQRSTVEAAYPRSPQFAEGFLQVLYDSLKHRPETTQATGFGLQGPRIPPQGFQQADADVALGYGTLAELSAAKRGQAVQL